VAGSCSCSCAMQQRPARQWGGPQQVAAAVGPAQRPARQWGGPQQATVSVEACGRHALDALHAACTAGRTGRARARLPCQPDCARAGAGRLSAAALYPAGKLRGWCRLSRTICMSHHPLCVTASARLARAPALHTADITTHSTWVLICRRLVWVGLLLKADQVQRCPRPSETRREGSREE